MTSDVDFYQILTEIVSDLSKDLPTKERFHNLLMAMQRVFPFDAAAVLQLEQGVLTPLAAQGLSDDTLGRRFTVAEHPRLSKVLHARKPIRFAADSPLPDPYDGLVDVPDLDLHVHDCMGVSLYVDDAPWGVLTLDALEPDTFDQIDLVKLETFVRLTEATVKAADRIARLTALNQQQLLINKTLVSEQQAMEILGDCPVMLELLKEIRIVAQSHLTVLVTGETGVGKELVARKIHHDSNRSDGALVYVNCAALPENIAESELFGHVKGAFTGAVSDRAGKFEVADGGTLFLDEVGELPLVIQAKLLRVIQSGEIQRVGSDRYIQCDVRLVAATNRELKQEVAEGKFRADLFHRLSVYPITVPPLRERGKDILLLAGHFLEINQRRLRVQGLRIDDAAKIQLLAYNWPGNVRELEHVLSRAALKAIAEQGRESRVVTLYQPHFDLLVARTSDKLIQSQAQYQVDNTVGFDESLTLKSAMDQFQVSLIEKAITHHRGNLAAAARTLGVNRSNFYRLLKRLDLNERSVE